MLIFEKQGVNESIMAHTQQANFCRSVRDAFPKFFSGVLVLDIGSLDINGNNQFLFSEDCLYLGVDVALGKNVDIVTPGHLLNLPSATFDVIISTECLEHDRYYIQTLQNIERLLKPGGLFLMTCATTGRKEHGTLRTSPSDAPLLQLVGNEWSNYYKNITESDIRAAIDVDHSFANYKFSVGDETHDLYFYGIKCGKHQKHCSASWLLDSSPRHVKIESLTRELGASQSSNTSLRRELDAILDSRSWRATYPFRALFNRLRKYKILYRKSKNALHYIIVGDFDSLKRGFRSIYNNKRSGLINLEAKNWGILTTKHTLYIAYLVAEKLRSYGWSVDIITDNINDFPLDMYFVICPQIFKSLPPGEKMISFQLEQSVSSRWFTSDYFKVLKRSLAVFDYSIINIDYLSKKGINYPHVFYLPIGTLRGRFCGSDFSEKKYEVLFYGDANSSPRRRRMLDALSNNFNVRECSEVFGEEMIREICSTRIVINIHYYENAILEMPRIQECLSHGVIVVSEDAQDRDEYPELQDVVRFFVEGDIDDMILTVQDALNHPIDNSVLLKAVDKSAERFSFMFDRAFVGLGFCDPEIITKDSLPIPIDAKKIVLSLPETVNRRNVYKVNPANDFFIFDGLRYSPGWIGCGLSYSYLALHAIKNNYNRMVVMEDDVLLPPDFDAKLKKVCLYLDTQDSWHLFAGVVASVHENTKIIKYDIYDDMVFITIDKMTSMVCNVYSELGMEVLSKWNVNDRNVELNTIDRYIENHQDLRVVVALPFLVGHREDVNSTLWGFNNSEYLKMINDSEKILKIMLDEFTS